MTKSETPKKKKVPEDTIRQDIQKIIDNVWYSEALKLHLINELLKGNK